MKYLHDFCSTLALIGSCLFISVNGAVLTSAQSKQLMIEDLEYIKRTFDTHYAPAQWKQSHLGWNLDQDFEKARQEIMGSETTPTIKEFQQTLKRFINSVQDYHVQIDFISTEQARLPFEVGHANGKYFVKQINTQLVSNLPFVVGDEILAFNDQPVKEIISGLMKESNQNPQSLTDQALANLKLTYRSGRKGDTVPRGPVNITFKSKSTGAVRSFQLIWDYEVEKIFPAGEPWILSPLSVDNLSNASEKETTLQLPRKLMLTPLYEIPMHTLKLSRCSAEDEDEDEDEDNQPEDEQPLTGLASRKSFIPELGTLIWQTEGRAPFHAYIYENEDHQKIGYIRIPHYAVFWEVEDYLEHFASLMQHFEDHTDALVIDQVDNPGGFVDYLYTLVSMLTDQPLKTPKHRISLTQDEIFDAIQILEILNEIKSEKQLQKLFGQAGLTNYQTLQFLKEHFRFILQEWTAGRVLTNPTYINGVDYINPHSEARYTKPLLILINELDFSGGDFFPAIMQDNKRATLFGTKTAGAGGFVNGAYFKNRHGIRGFSYTGSIAERADFQPIESLGVTPDIEYRLKETDYKNNYQSYRSAVNQAVKTLLHREPVTIEIN